MNKKDRIDLVLKAKDNVYFFWNFYVVGLLAVIAWLGSFDCNPVWQLKLLISIGFLSFMFMNISGLLGSFALLRAAMRDYFPAASKEENVIYEIDQAFRKEKSIFKPIGLGFLEIPKYKLVVFGLHILIDTLILIAVWSDGIWTSLRSC